MTPGENIKMMRKGKKMTIVELSEQAKLSKSTISDIENGKSNPSIATLNKIANVFDIPVEMILDPNITDTLAYKRRFSINSDPNSEFYNFKESYCDNTETKNNTFTSAEEAMQFILSQPSIMAYGGFDINKLSDRDKIEFANDLLNQLKLISYKYNK